MTQTSTFLFTDIEGSTRLWQQYPQIMGEIIARHDALLASEIEAYNGRVFKTTGDGIHAIFDNVSDALHASVAVQHAVHKEPWQVIDNLLVRMAVHTGPATFRDGDYYGNTLNYVARLMDAGHGGQILLSQNTQELLGEALPAGASLRDMGERRLKDWPKPVCLYQLEVEGLPNNFPPLKTLDIRPSNLPALPNALIGRDQEIRAVRRQLLHPDNRLLTLTGPGGTGKTRLALQAAAYMLDDFEHGVFYVPLSAITDPSQVVTVIAKALGVTEQQGSALAEAVAAHLSDQSLLLVLDNFEQVLMAGPILANWLAAAPRLKILVTSRERLSLYGERDFPVPPLALPDLEQLPSLQDLYLYPAIALFVERARAVRADFEVTEDNGRAVVEICARLDGLPLAIELAAARIKFFTPAILLQRLSDRLQLLSGGPRDLPARQQSLRGAIAWSYDLLDEPEKRLFARLSVFRGGGTFATIDSICADELVPVPLDTLESLVNKSLVKMLESTTGDEPRFGMLESIATYAQTQLTISGEADVFQRRHATIFLALAKDAEATLAGPDQISGLDRLDLEHDNLWAALAWAEDAGDYDLVLGLNSALWPFWFRRGYWSEGRRLLARALTLYDGNLPLSSEAAGVLHGLGVLSNEQGHNDEARHYLSDSLACYHHLADDRGAALALNDLGYTALLAGEIEKAREYSEESRELFSTLDDEWGVAIALNNLGATALAQGDAVAATHLCKESLKRFTAAGDKWGMALALNNLGLAALPQGDYAAAAQFAERSLALFREVSAPRY